MKKLDLWFAVYEFCEEKNIQTSKELEDMALDLHAVMEEAIIDYAADHDIDDYQPFV